MAISRAEQSRIAMTGVLVATPVVVVTIVLTVTYGETLIGWAEEWPGGPTAFMVTLAAIDAVTLLTVALACLTTAWPDRTPPGLRLSAGRRAAVALVGGLVTIVTAVPLASTRPRWPGDETSCDDDVFGCVLRTEHSGAVTAGWMTFVAVVVVGSGALAWLFRRRTA